MAICKNQDKELALVEEVHCAIYLLEFGLLALNRIKNVEHLPILLLSNGFERLLKMIICLDYLKQHGEFPNPSNFKKTHDVEKLLNEVVSIANKWKYSEKDGLTKEDMSFLKDDDVLKKLIKCLARYGETGRYYNINVIVGEKNISDNPVEIFDNYRTEISKSMPDSKKKDLTAITPEEGLQEQLCYANQQITRALQRFARALCRMFVGGKLGQTGNNMSQIIGYFLVLGDADLGQLKFSWLN